MKNKLLAILAVGLLAGSPLADAVPVTVGSQTVDVLVCTGTWIDCLSQQTLTDEPWWGSSGFGSAASEWGNAWLIANSALPEGDRYVGALYFAFGVNGVLKNAYICTTQCLNFGTSIETAADWAYAASITTVPEPSALALFGLGLAGLGFARRRKNA